MIIQKYIQTELLTSGSSYKKICIIWKAYYSTHATETISVVPFLFLWFFFVFLIAVYPTD